MAVNGGGASFSGGSGGAGGYRFQALASAYVAAHALAAHPLNWVGSVEAVPAAVSAETGGPGDDLRVEFLAGGDLEIQAKRGLNNDARLWEAILRLARGLDRDGSLRCMLLVDYGASKTVRDQLALDIRRLSQGRDDRLRPVGVTFLDNLRREGVRRERRLLERLSVVAADLGGASTGEGLALALLARATEKSKILNAWDALREDGMLLTEEGGRSDLRSWWRLLEARGIHPADPAELAAQEREDNVPPVPRPFVGRDGAVDAVAAVLATAGDGRRPVAAVRGLPGAGKSAVAAAVVEALRLEFPGGVFWASLGPTLSPLSVLAAWGRSIGAEDLADYADVGAASSRMRALLRERKALIVLDDVWDPAHARPFEVGGPESATLATTRSRSVASELAGAAGAVDLGVLAEADAEALLHELAPSLDAQHSGALAELARKLGGLPLLLRVAGRLLEERASPGLGAGKLLSELAEGEGLLEAAVPPDLADLVGATTPTVAVLLGRSTDFLPEEERGRFARLAAFAPGPSTFDLPAVREVWEATGDEEAGSTLAALARRGLVEPDGLGRFSVHPVLRMQAKALLGRAPVGDRGPRFLHASHYLGLLRSAGALFAAGREARAAGSALFDGELGNVGAGQAWAASRLGRDLEDVEAARLVADYADAGWRWLSMRVDLEEQIRWLEDAIGADRILAEADADAVQEGTERIPRAHRAAEARHLHLLANARRLSGQTDEAFALEQQSREIFSFLGDRRGESRPVNGLAALYTHYGNYARAEECFREALRLLDAEDAGSGAGPPVSRDRDVDRAATLGNLGSFYRNVGRLGPAEEAIGGAVAIFRKAGEAGQVGIAYDNLGALRSDGGDKAGARRLFSAARRIFRFLGARQDEALALLNIARVHADVGEHARAEREALEVIETCEEFGLVGFKGWALDTLGDARLGLGNRRGATEAHEAQLDVAGEVKDRRLEVMALASRGRIELSESESGPDPEAALSLFGRAAGVASLGVPPHLRGSVLFDEALALDALGRRAEAVGKAREALEILDGHPPAKVAEIGDRLDEWTR